jgi:hypothetical protein
LHSSHVLPMATMTASPCSSRCLSSLLLSLCCTSSMRCRARCLMSCSLSQCIYGTVCAGAKFGCDSEEDAVVHEGCSVPGQPQSHASRPLHNLQPPSRNLLHNSVSICSGQYRSFSWQGAALSQCMDSIAMYHIAAEVPMKRKRTTVL